jgi:hypothetical protein
MKKNKNKNKNNEKTSTSTTHSAERKLESTIEGMLIKFK